jgi:hypothetical protein
MKRTALSAIVLAFIVTIAMVSPTMAETQKAEQKNCPMMEMMGKDAKAKEGCPMGDMPMRCMMGKQMVATPDGGFVVSICNKLYKYDSNLNLQKEVEIPFNKDCMMKMMKDMDMTGDKMDKPEENMPEGTDTEKGK